MEIKITVTPPFFKGLGIRISDAEGGPFIEYSGNVHCFSDAPKITKGKMPLSGDEYASLVKKFPASIKFSYPDIAAGLDGTLYEIVVEQFSVKYVVGWWSGVDDRFALFKAFVISVVDFILRDKD